MTPSAASVLAELRAHANPRNVEGMARFGIKSANVLGLNVPTLRAMARRMGRQHDLALELWDSGIHEARMLASMIDDPHAVTLRQMERWVASLDSWDVCDCVCGTLFDKTPFAWRKAEQWSRRRPEFVKRAAFSLMAQLAVHDKAAPDARFVRLLPIIEREADDVRNFVKKAVNWALRQIGKRNPRLRRRAIQTARRLRRSESSAARWVASDALRELVRSPSRNGASNSRAPRVG